MQTSMNAYLIPAEMEQIVKTRSMILHVTVTLDGKEKLVKKVCSGSILKQNTYAFPLFCLIIFV